jgi:hypothetical protein
MNEIICPHCDKAFKIDETGYADILKQVRNREFEKEIHERLERAETDKDSALRIAEQESANAIQKSIGEKDIEIERYKSIIREKESAVNSTVEQAVRPIEKSLVEKNIEIERLKFLIREKDNSVNSTVEQALRPIEKDRDNLKNKLESSNLEKKVLENFLKDKYETQIRDRDDAIERLKDMKAKLSTKMVGETLEQHCEIEFNRLRSSAFQTAYFEKDNDSRMGSKGDYIFKDHDENSTEIISIMFEMKNESDFTATKSKNEDFLKELDKDRNEKGCEYAVLVSLLESESELYNTGIVDVFHRYPKMYVIRPQFFIPIITLLRNAAMHSLKYKTQLAQVREQNIDITNFETELDQFKATFGKNYDLASRKFQVAVDQIDKSIISLQKTKDALLSADKNLRIANDKSKDVTIKRLTRNNPTMAEKFAELHDD